MEKRTSKWKHPIDESTSKQKDESYWLDTEDKQYNYNSKAISTIYAYVNIENFGFIKTCQDAHTM